MATAGPRYPGTVATEVGPSGDNDWTNPTNISANDGSEAEITAASYDANDHSYRLKATNFGFDADVPAGSTINGILVEIEQRRFAGAAEDQEVRLYDSTGTLVGDDKQTATAWPGTATIASYGGATDTWNAGLDADDIRSTGFGVAHIVLATAANTDIGVDFIRVTIDYTAPVVVALAGVSAGVSTAAGNASVTRGLQAASAGASTAAGNVVLSLALQATSAGVGSVTGNASLALGLQATSAGLSTVAGNISRSLGLAVASAGASIVSGDVTVSGGSVEDSSANIHFFMH